MHGTAVIGGTSKASAAVFRRDVCSIVIWPVAEVRYMHVLVRQVALCRSACGGIGCGQAPPSTAGD
jgi:hypothetical protein